MDVQIRKQLEQLEYIKEKLVYVEYDEHLQCYVEKVSGIPTGVAAWVNGAFYGFEQAAKASVPEWISTSEHMPDEGQEVLVHHYGNIVQATKDKNYSGGFKKRNCYGWESVSAYISHWMPKNIKLPESFHFYYDHDAKVAKEKAMIEAQELSND